MRSSDTSDNTRESEAALPWQQWILLPAIGLLTILVLAVGTEFTARLLYPVSITDYDKCFVADELSGTAPVRPNGVCMEQVAESRLPVEYRFNSRGHRAGIELTHKEPGGFRIVMIGSSMAMGLFVPQPLTFGALLPKELSPLTGRRVELYNEATGGKYRGGPYPTPQSVPRFKEVLAAEPDMILWVITPMDVQNAGVNTPPASSKLAGSASGTAPGALATLENKLRYRWEQTRTSVVLKHLLLGNESQDQYVNSYLKDDEDAAFLKTTPSAGWQRSFDAVARDAQEFAIQANAAGVPFVVVLVPNRAQAAMISRGVWPEGYDPYKLGHMLRTTIEAHGGAYIDILPELRSIPNPEQHYFPVDGHLDAEGHAMIARLLVAKLAPQTQAALAQGR